MATFLQKTPNLPYQRKWDRLVTRIFEHSVAINYDAKGIETPTIPYSQLLAREEEDILLGWEESAIPSPTTPDKVQQLKSEIVAHCTDMRKSLMSMTKADHHKAASCENIHTKTFPKGLCAFIEPHIFEPPTALEPCWLIVCRMVQRNLLPMHQGR